LTIRHETLITVVTVLCIYGKDAFAMSCAFRKSYRPVVYVITVTLS